MVHVLQNFIPQAAFDQVTQLLSHDNLVVKIKQERKTRHGDYRRLPNGKHQITINSNLNTYRFLITLIHEIAHFEAYKSYGKMIKPHGLEWKSVFQHLMLPFLRLDIYPEKILSLLAKYLQNAKASTDSDVKLSLALKGNRAETGKYFIFDLDFGNVFSFKDILYKKGNKRRTRYECLNLKNKKVYLFNQNVEVKKHLSTNTSERSF